MSTEIKEETRKRTEKKKKYMMNKESDIEK